MTGNCQKCDNDVTCIPAEQQFGVPSDRQVQPTDFNFTLVPAEQQFGVQSDRQIQQHDITLSPADGHIEVTGNCQKHDNDVTCVPAERQFGVPSDRQVQPTDFNFALVPAERQFGVQSDRQIQQQHDPVLAKKRDEGDLDVFGNEQELTAVHPVERHFQVYSSKITSQMLPQSI